MALNLDQCTALADAAQCALVDLIEAEAQKIMDERADVDAVVCAQGLNYIRDTQGDCDAITFEEFPDFLQALGVWESYYGLQEPGVYLTREMERRADVERRT